MLVFARKWTDAFDFRKFSMVVMSGCLGSLLAAVVAEGVLLVLLPPPPPKPDAVPTRVVDVMFVLDVTGSMQDEIDGVSQGIQNFATELGRRNLDARVGLIAFTDRLTGTDRRGNKWTGKEPDILTFGNGPFTNDMAAFRSRVGRFRADGGGDPEESSLDATALAARQPFRPSAVKVVILITDVPPHIPDREMKSVDGTAAVVRNSGIDQLHLVVPQEFLSTFAGLHSGAPGTDFPLTDASGGRVRFDTILPEVGKAIAVAAVGTAISTGSFAADQYWTLVLLTGLWTGLLALGIFLSLAMGQNYYFGRPLLEWKRGLAGGLGSFIAGMTSGIAGQILFGALGSSTVLQLAGRIVAWVIFGAVIGRGVALFVPNLSAKFATIGGSIGGAVGAVCFALASGLLGDSFGRFVGAMSLGLAIGILLLFVETAFREAWLEVRYQKGTMRRVSLGRTPVTLGSSETLATVYCRDAAPVALSFRVENGSVRCEDIPLGSISLAEDGQLWTVGAVSVALRSPVPGRRSVVAPEPGPTTDRNGRGLATDLIPAAKVILAIEWPLPLGDSVIGSSEAADLSIRDAGLSVQHVSLTVQSSRAIVTPINGVSPTLVSFDGALTSLRVVSGRNAVRDGSVLKLGDLLATVRAEPLRLCFDLSVQGPAIKVGGQDNWRLSSTASRQSPEVLFSWASDRFTATCAGGSSDVFFSFTGDGGQFKPLTGRSAVKSGSRLRIGDLAIRITIA